MRFRTENELYEQQRKKDEEKKKARNMLATMKEIKFTTAIDEHDLEIRLRKIRSLLEKQLAVEIHIQLPKIRDKNFTSEEQQRIQRELLDRIYRTVEDIATRYPERYLPRMTLCTIFKPKSL